MASTLIVVATVLAAVAALGGWIDLRVKSRQNDTREEIKTAVDHLSDVLVERLETKENVANLRTEVATLKERLGGMLDRIDHISSRNR